VANERDHDGKNQNESNRDDFSQPDQITPDRLIEVAMSVFDACNEWSQMHRGNTIYPTDLLGSPEQPKSMTEFTRFEVEEAAMFLVRMGFIQPPRATKAP
jgi:hypothetical protein